MLVEYYPDSAERLEEMRQAEWQRLQQQPGWTPADAIARLRDRIASLEGDTSPGGQVQRRQFKSNLEWILKQMESEEYLQSLVEEEHLRELQAEELRSRLLPRQPVPDYEREELR